MRRHTLAVLALLTATSGCDRDGAGHRAAAGTMVERSQLAMGSTLKVEVWTVDAADAPKIIEEVFAEFARLERLMSVWVPDSDVSRMNRAAGAAPVAVSAEVRELLGLARQVSDWTGGKFDVTFGALTGLWRFDHDQNGEVPDMQAVRRRLPLIDYRAVRLDEAALAAQVARSGMSVHLGGIGKGYAVDRAVAMLRARGIEHFLIQSGGDIYAGGTKNGRPWRLGIQDPRGVANHIFADVALSDGAISTSGDYERYFLRDGIRYHHILDPATGEPARGTRSVTIVARRAAIADALSTGVFVMGPTAGMALIERLPDVEGVIVSERNEVAVSSGLRSTLRLLAEPTAN